jgi:predicted DNA-binding transcriptional regulator YafY
MRAARILQMLLILQNRGRLTSARLAEELEVTPRTILRDVDALTEAGLPIIVFQGAQGGIELGFGYRTRLTGLAADEAEALGVILQASGPELAALGMSDAARRAQAKLVESLPDGVREKVGVAMGRYKVERTAGADIRVAALAKAVRQSNVVVINARGRAEQVHPVGLRYDGADWWLEDALGGREIVLADCGDLNISSKVFG